MSDPHLIRRRPDDGGDTDPEVEFRPIDMERDAEICVWFRADSFVCSFGSSEQFFAEAGPGARDYLEGLDRKNAALPGSCVHVWLGGEIVGQVEATRDPTDPTVGHVALYYLVPRLRGTGLAVELDRYALDLLRDNGMQRAFLRVSPANGRAVRFCEKQGWVSVGPDPAHPQVVRMEKRLAPAGENV